MTSDRQRQIRELYDAALEREPDERAAYLTGACGDDESLRREVESLLAFHLRAEDFIEQPALGMAAEAIVQEKVAAVGREIAHYRIIALLGAGGMGEVYLAHDGRLARRVALKLLPAEFTADPARVRRFEREARAASALNHPNILTVHEIGQADGAHFIAAEFVEGETLRERLAAGKLPLTEALDAAAQIAAALVAAHRAGIIHRDIKPENVMLRRDGYVKVLDFGLARITEAGAGDADLRGATVSSLTTEPGTVIGTVAYMSPEQLRALDTDGRTDLWSLGVVLYEMIAGRRPFAGATTSAMIAAILEQEPPPVAGETADVPEELNRIISRALQKNCEPRYRTAEEMLADLKRLQQELTFAEKLKQHSAGRVSYETAPLTVTVTGRQSAKRLPAALRKHWLLFVLAALVIAAGMFVYRRSANLQWAREQLPQIERFTREQKYFEAYRLSLRVQKYLPGDATLARLLPTIADSLSVTTEPSGARVYLRRFAADHSATPRELIGTTPISNLPVARGEYIMTVEKHGYAPAERTISSLLTHTGNALVPPDDPRNFQIRLIETDKAPARMAFVPGGKYRLTSRTRPAETSVQLDDFFIDRYEVTNREYKEFITAGGYFRREYWKYPFVKNGRTLSYDEAMHGFRDRTGLAGPRSWSGQDFPEGKADHPVTDITWYEAAAYAAFRGKQLPTVFQWEKAARNGSFTYYMGYVLPWGAVEYGGNVEGHANFNGRSTVPVESLEFGMSPFGCYHMAGNVSEWCLNEVSEGFTVAGGSWGDPFYLFSDIGALPGFFSSNKLGFRCVQTLPNATGDQGAERLETFGEVPVHRPTSEAEFRAMLSHFRYDQSPLGAQVVEVRETGEWRRERITYAGAKDERVIAYLYLPKSARPPFQVIQYVPAGDAYGGFFTAAESAEMQVAPFIKSGRAVFSVVFKGFREREHPPGYIPPKWDTVRRREEVISNSTDLSRGLDYLATRPDLDLSRVTFYGFSQGAEEGLIYTAVESRFRAVVLVAGNLPKENPRWLPEVNPANFAPHISAPLLMLNGRYDEVNPLRASIEPLFKLLREPKKMFVYDSGHSPPFEIAVPVINTWLDETLGPVRHE